MDISLLENGSERGKTESFFFMTMLQHQPHHQQVRDTSETLDWKVLPRAAYSPGLTPSDYYFFASISHALAEQRFDSYEDVKKCLDEWFTTKGENFY